MTKKAKVPQCKPYEIKRDEAGNEWFCAAGKEQSKFSKTFSKNTDSTLSSYLSIWIETVYHSDIRYDLEHHSKLSIPRGGPRKTIFPITISSAYLGRLQVDVRC